MGNIQFHIIQPSDTEFIQLIAQWYLQEWKIPVEKTMLKLRQISGDNTQFQVLMKLDNIPIATAGLHHHVGLIDKEPRFRIYNDWLALVYAIRQERGKGYGASICKYVEDYAKNIGIKKMYLFTDTAESLYRRLGWVELERVNYKERKVVLMEKELLNVK